MNDILILQYNSANSYGVEYKLKLRIKWIYDLIFDKKKTILKEKTLI